MMRSQSKSELKRRAPNIIIELTEPAFTKTDKSDHSKSFGGSSFKVSTSRSKTSGKYEKDRKYQRQFSPNKKIKKQQFSKIIVSNKPNFSKNCDLSDTIFATEEDSVNNITQHEDIRNAPNLLFCDFRKQKRKLIQASKKLCEDESITSDY